MIEMELSGSVIQPAPTKPTAKQHKAPKLKLDLVALSAEKLSSAAPSREACIKCGIFAGCKTPFLKPYVPQGWTGKLLIVAEEPGEKGRPTAGDVGRLLRRLWLEAGYRDNDIAYAFAVRCAPKRGATPSMSSVRACRPFVLRAIDLLHPAAVIGLGGTALRSLTNRGDSNVTNARGRLLVTDIKVPCFITYDPSAILRGGAQYHSRILEDLKAVFEPVLEGPTLGIPSGNIIAIDTEFAPPPEKTLLTLGVANGKTSIALEGDYGTLSGCLSAAKYLVGHSVGSADLRYLSTLGLLRDEWVTGEHLLDSLLLARMVDENGGKGSYELENLFASFARVKPWKAATVAIDKKNALLWGADLRMERCRTDAWASYRVASFFHKQLNDKHDLVRYTHKIAAVLDRIALAGAFVDMNAFTSMRDRLGLEVLRTRDLLSKTAAIHGVANFSATNDTNIRDLLYGKLALPVLNRTKKDKLPSVDQITLKNLDHDVARLLLEHNKVDKLYSVNGIGLEGLIRPVGVVDATPVGWLPFHINPLGARTGRRSSNNPNSQNWPGSVRGIIRSRYPGGVIADFDYKRLEVVLIAWVSGDEKLLEAFTKGRGYLDVAHDLWGKEIVADTPEYKATKSVVLGVNYNMQGKKMARELWNRVGVKFSADYEEHERKTEEVRKKYLALHRPLAVYMAERKRELLGNQGVQSLTGRWRHLPLPDGEETEGFYRFYNQAINFPIQSLASEVTGAALMDIERELLSLHGLTYTQYYQYLLELNAFYLTNDPEGPRVKMTAQMELPLLINEVHDSIVLDIPPSQLKKTQELVVETMRKVPSLHQLCPAFAAPLDCDWKIGAAWGKKT